MEALFAIGGITLGVNLVVAGADVFVDGLLGLGERLRVSPFVLMVLLSGFEVENLAAGIAANANGLPGAAAGTVFGGVAFLALGVAGLGALIAPIRATITEGRIKKAKLGGMPGRAPLGYLNVRHWDGANDIRTIEVDPDRAPHIRWAFQVYATGEWTLRGLTDALEDRGLRSLGTPKFRAKPIRSTALQRMLRNPFYRGVVRFKGVEYEGSHEPLLTPELFEKVQQRLTAQALAGERQWKHEHHLKGTLYCRLCGSRLVFTKCTGRRGGRYDYFVWAKRHRGKGCDLPYLPARRIEEVVADYYVSQVKLDAERIASLEPQLVRIFQRLTGYRQREMVRARNRVDDLLAQRRRLVEGHLARPEAIPLEVLEEKQADLVGRRGFERRLLSGASRARTDDPFHAMEVLFQLSYSPIEFVLGSPV